MEANECKTKAIATWERFDAQVSDALLRAVSGAFAIVACSDGHLDESEIEVFLDMVKDTRAFADVDMSLIEQQFRELGRAILDDYEEGRRRAMESISALTGNVKQTALVVSAAQIAIVADEKLQDVEETILGQICEALGLDPKNY